MLVFTGASAHFGLGMRDWLKRHRKQLDPEATAVISLDNIGGGEVAFSTKEGPIFASRMHPTLSELAGELGAERFESREVSDAYLARSAGLPALRISTTEPGTADPDGVARVCEFTGALLERIDGEIGPLVS
jgi:Iap family predicted aminopeptidase